MPDGLNESSDSWSQGRECQSLRWAGVPERRQSGMVSLCTGSRFRGGGSRLRQRSRLLRVAWSFRLARRYSRRDVTRSAESHGRCEAPLTRVVACAFWSRRNASEVRLSSPGTRLEAAETNAMKRPPKLSGPDPVKLGPFAAPPRVEP